MRIQRDALVVGLVVLGGFAASSASANLEGFVESGDRVTGDLRSGGETDTFRLAGASGDVLEAVVRANRSVTVKLLDSSGAVMTQQTGRNVHVVANALTASGQVSVQIVGSTSAGKSRYTAMLTCGDETGDRRLDLREATIGAATTAVEADMIDRSGGELAPEHISALGSASALFTTGPRNAKPFVMGATAHLTPNGLTAVGPAVLVGPLPKAVAAGTVQITLPYDPSQVSLAPQVIVAGLDKKTSVVRNVTIDAANSVVRFFPSRLGIFQVFDATSTIGPVTGTSLSTSDAAALDQMSSVAIQNGRMVVGVMSHVVTVGGQPANHGAAYVFEQGTGGAWTEVAQLAPADVSTVAGFGKAVAIDGDRIVVSSVGGSPAVHVFDRVAGTWTVTASIAGGFTFGTDIALQGDRLAVGDPMFQGSVTVYDFDGTDWVLDARIAAGPTSFGASVAMDGDRILAGTPSTGVPGGRGMAYTYVKVSGSWLQEAQIRPADGTTNDQFGTDVALEDDRIVIGAWYARGVPEATGAAYVFERVSGLWTQAARVANPNGATNERFASAVALSGARVLIGSPMSNAISTEGGMTYLVQRSGSGSWSAPQAIVPAGIGLGDHVGSFLALDGAISAIGAPGADTGATNAGVVHILDLTGR